MGCKKRDRGGEGERTLVPYRFVSLQWMVLAFLSKYLQHPHSSLLVLTPPTRERSRPKNRIYTGSLVLNDKLARVGLRRSVRVWCLGCVLVGFTDGEGG